MAPTNLFYLGRTSEFCSVPFGYCSVTSENPVKDQDVSERNVIHFTIMLVGVSLALILLGVFFSCGMECGFVS